MGKKLLDSINMINSGAKSKIEKCNDCTNEEYSYALSLQSDCVPDFKIMIIGHGWDNSLLKNHRNIFINNCSYKEKNEALNNCKIFLNLSLIEGGPVTLLEAIASGCNSISKDNGIAYDINLDFPKKCFNIKNILSSQNLSKEIIDIYLKHLKNENKNLANLKILHSYSFEYLGKRLVKILEI